MRNSERYAVVRLLLASLTLSVIAFLAVSCQVTTSDTPEDGTVTASITGAGAENTKPFYFLVYGENATVGVDDPDGVGMAVIASGVAQDTAHDVTYTNIVNFIGGTKYFVFAYTDHDSGIWSPSLESGDYFSSSEVFTIDGNVTLAFDFSTFSYIP